MRGAIVRLGTRLTALAALLAPVALTAQGAPASRCVLQFEPLRGTPPRTNFVRLPGEAEKYNVFQGGGVRYRCEGQPVTLEADSAEYYGVPDILYLIGAVHYTEPRATVDARRMTYFKAEERILAEGNVFARLPTGSTMRGPQADYYRMVPGVRERARLVAGGRPHITLVQADSAGRAQEPVLLVANRVTMDGDSLVYASGQVEITRTDIDARSDSAFLDAGREYAQLLRTPSIRGKGERPFTLSGAIIDLFSRNRLLQRVVSSTKARAVSEDLTLTSDTIDMRVDGNKLQRAYAWGTSRAHAVSPDRDITADSIDVLLPAQQVREVRAVGGAFAQTLPDTTKIRSGERDWLRGDTIVARFDTLPAAAPDTSSRPRLDELVSRGHASSLYQIQSQRGPSAPPSINYVRGRMITVDVAGQEVNTVSVIDSAAGLYLEAAAPDSTLPADSAAPAGARDSASAPVPARPVPPDTVRRAPASAPPSPAGRPRPSAPTRPASPQKSGVRP